MVFHVEGVPEGGDPGELHGTELQVPFLIQPGDDLAGRPGLPGSHAGSRHDDQRELAGEMIRRRDGTLGDVHHLAVAVAQAQDLDPQRMAEVLVGGGGDPNDTAHVEHVEHVAGVDPVGAVADESLEGPAGAQRADDDVVLGNVGQPAGDQLQLVVDPFLLERFHHDDVARARRAALDDVELTVDHVATGRRRDLVHYHPRGGGSHLRTRPRSQQHVRSVSIFVCLHKHTCWCSTVKRFRPGPGA